MEKRSDACRNIGAYSLFGKKRAEGVSRASVRRAPHHRLTRHCASFFIAACGKNLLPGNRHT